MMTLHRTHHQLDTPAVATMAAILVVLFVLALGVMAQLPAAIGAGLDPLPAPQPSHVVAGGEHPASR